MALFRTRPRSIRFDGRHVGLRRYLGDLNEQAVRLMHEIAADEVRENDGKVHVGRFLYQFYFHGLGQRVAFSRRCKRARLTRFGDFSRSANVLLYVAMREFARRHAVWQHVPGDKDRDALAAFASLKVLQAQEAAERAGREDAGPSPAAQPA